MEIVNVCLWFWVVPALLPNAPNPIYIYIQQPPHTHIKVIIKKHMTHRYANMELERLAIDDVFVFMFVRNKTVGSLETNAPPGSTLHGGQRFDIGNLDPFVYVLKFEWCF